MSEPSRVRFTQHAHMRITRRRLGLDLIDSVVLEAHGRRGRNPGQADWRLVHRGVVVLYDWPAAGDETTALVRSAWQR